MPVLEPTAYDIAYFDGKKSDLRHNAGYSKYERWKRHRGENSSGEFWLDKAKEFINTHALQNKKVLEIGSAKGFMVEDLRSLGVNAWGLDVSQYAYNEAAEAVKPYLKVGDARTYLTTYSRNEWDILFSLRFTECISETDLPDLITEMNRVSKKQIHVIDESGNENYYVIQPLSWWATKGFARGTILVSNTSKEVLVI